MKERNNLQFGNGYSLKYFNFLYAIFIPGMIIGLISNFTSQQMDFVGNYNSNSELYYSVTANRILMFSLFLNIIINLIITHFRMVGNKRLFSIWFLSRIGIDFFVGLFVYSSLKEQFPNNTSIIDFADSKIFTAFVIFLILFIPHFLYLYKRLKKINNTLLVVDTEVNLDTMKVPLPNVIKLQKKYCGQCGALIETNKTNCNSCGYPY